MLGLPRGETSPRLPVCPAWRRCAGRAHRGEHQAEPGAALSREFGKAEVAGPRRKQGWVEEGDLQSKLPNSLSQPHSELWRVNGP